MLTLDVKALTDFMAEVFRQYARRQQFRVAPQPGAVRIDCEDDLWRHYSLDKGWMQAYKMEDNATCVHPIPPGTKLGPPGWGGAYAGSKPRCIASHDLIRVATSSTSALWRSTRWVDTALQLRINASRLLLRPRARVKSSVCSK